MAAIGISPPQIRHHDAVVVGFSSRGLSWLGIVGIWIAWLSGLIGPSLTAWGGLLLMSAMWAVASALDRLQLDGALRTDLGAILRASLLGAAAIAAPMALTHPIAHLNVWGAVMVTALAAQLLTPSGRTWNDFKAATGAAGSIVAAPILLTAATGLFDLTPDRFINLVALATFCVAPTVLTVRRSDFAQSDVLDVVVRGLRQHEVGARSRR
jgi:hypothetical protein